MTTARVRELAKQAWVGYDNRNIDAVTFVERFSEFLVEECINCYSPDDSPTDWADKMRALIHD